MWRTRKSETENHHGMKCWNSYALFAAMLKVETQVIRMALYNIFHIKKVKSSPCLNANPIYTN